MNVIQEVSGAAGDMAFTYFNATYTVENALSKVKDEKGMKRVEKFLKQGVCPDCGGTRLSEVARRLMDLGLGYLSLDRRPKPMVAVWWLREPSLKLPRMRHPESAHFCRGRRGSVR